MPLFKQVTAQQKRSKRKAEALLSDEENSSSDEEQLDAGSDSEAGSGSDESDSELDGEDEELVGASDEEEEGEPEVLDEDEPRPPPVGFPTAKEALENTVASTAALIAEMDAEKGEGEKENAEDDEEAPLVCVVCPNKILKPGKMVEVHLASKDHKRRFNRYKTHVESPEFVADHLDADARWVASQLDKAVLARLSAQTHLGGKKAAAIAASAPAPSTSTSAPPAPLLDVASASTSSPAKKENAPTTKSDPSSSSLNPTKQQLAAEAEAAGMSVRELTRRKWKAEKKERAKKRKVAKKEKFEERKRAKLEKGEKPEPFITSKPRFVEKIKPTAEEIEIRQKWKAERNEAKAKGLPPPKKPVLAYELGGKVPVEKKPAPKKEKGKAKGKGVKVDKTNKKKKRKSVTKGEADEGEKELLPEV
ncbi:uncharacterized protein JCM6883_005011 [Sporobolomyces salmoneus]|uniref:uncharacterized protein n=1 Tax=Sporobolomyces salmoneus TaxID=183962 RepID=UPI00317037CB